MECNSSNNLVNKKGKGKMDAQDDQSPLNDPCSDLALSPPPKPHYVYAATCVNGFRLYNGLDLTDYKRICVLPHGLWLENYSASSLQAPFDLGLVPMDRALAVWGSAKDGHPAFDWAYQWNTHGKYGKLNQSDYFNLILDTQEYLSPIIEAGLLDSLTPTRVGSRRYLDLVVFTNYMRSFKCFCTVHVQAEPWVITSRLADGVTFTYEELIEVRFYLDFEDPKQTLLSRGLGNSRYTNEMDINVR